MFMFAKMIFATFYAHGKKDAAKESHIHRQDWNQTCLAVIGRLLFVKCPFSNIGECVHVPFSFLSGSFPLENFHMKSYFHVAAVRRSTDGRYFLCVCVFTQPGAKSNNITGHPFAGCQSISISGCPDINAGIHFFNVWVRPPPPHFHLCLRIYCKNPDTDHNMCFFKQNIRITDVSVTHRVQYTYFASRSH